jgi:hypothetical protein
VLLDRLVPSFELLQRNALTLWRNHPISAAIDRPARLSSYERYSLFALVTLLYFIALLALWRGTDFYAELILCIFALPPAQHAAHEMAWLQQVWAARDARVRRLAAKCVVRAIKAISWALVHRPALLHSADVLPHIDLAPQLMWQVLRHGAMTAMLLYIRRYSQRGYYTAYKYFYYYQTDQWAARPTAQQARRHLIKLLDEQRWSEFASARTFGLAVVLYHEGDPEIPQWIATVNFALARFFAVVTLAQAIGAWRADLAPLGIIASLLLVQRSELARYWQTVLAAALGVALCAAGGSVWLGALVATWRPFCFARSAIKFFLKRLVFALRCPAPAVWLLCAALPQPQCAPYLLAYSATLDTSSAMGLFVLLFCGAASRWEPMHLLACAAVASVLYVLAAYSQRPASVLQPKTTMVQGFHLIENYKAT